MLREVHHPHANPIEHYNQRLQRQWKNDLTKLGSFQSLPGVVSG